MPELEIDLETNAANVSEASTSQRLHSFKEFLLNSKYFARRPTPEAEPQSTVESKRRSNTVSGSADGIEETLYVPSSEKRALILGADQNPPNSNGKDKNQKSSVFASTDTLFAENKCRICHSGANQRSDPLVSPCRCNGTMQFVHLGCLTHWLEVSSEKFWPTNECELCGYRFRRHPICMIRRLHFPSCTYQDKVLNSIFLFLVFLMIVCGTIASKYSNSQDVIRYRTLRVVRIGNAFFSGDEIMVVVAGILFFFCFILALCSQYRAGGTIFRQCVRFWTINRNWQIKNYNPSSDPGRTRAVLPN
uniref:RING-CH-type domain-containing protein n=1 Tax=Panagrolaimus sp. JU765 TaxID=591449 RepID=A0AC34QMP9_9BILA